MQHLLLQSVWAVFVIDLLMVSLLHPPVLFAQDLLKEGSKGCAPHHLGILLVYHIQVSQSAAILLAIIPHWSDAGACCSPAPVQIHHPLLPPHPVPPNSTMPNTALLHPFFR